MDFLHRRALDGSVPQREIPGIEETAPGTANQAGFLIPPLSPIVNSPTGVDKPLQRDCTERESRDEKASWRSAKVSAKSTQSITDFRMYSGIHSF